MSEILLFTPAHFRGDYPTSCGCRTSPASAPGCSSPSSSMSTPAASSVGGSGSPSKQSSYFQPYLNRRWPTSYGHKCLGCWRIFDGWIIRRKLRCFLWKQWNRPHSRGKNLMKAGLTDERAIRSAFNQRGPWWKSGKSNKNQAFPKKYFDRLGLVSVLETVQRLQCSL